jgi:drug/metabolite transporter (DMT)-like permease
VSTHAQSTAAHTALGIGLMLAGTGQVVGSLLFGLVAAPFGWVTPSLADVVVLGLFGATAVAALFCVNRSLTLAPASVVVPYQYTMIVWGALLGYLVFGDVPSVNVFVGAAIIVAAGLYIFVREQARRM